MLTDIWASAMRLPAWVLVWVFLILVPVNTASLFYSAHPFAGAVCALAILGMFPNLAIMMAERGLSKLMSLPHLIFWTPLVVLIVWVLATQHNLTPSYQMFLWLLLGVNLISLAFDAKDFFKWVKGDRAVA